MASSRNSTCTDLPQQAVRQAVEACLTQHGVYDKRLCIALSGGMDSMALLDVCHQLAQQFSLSLSALHVHHGLSAHADEWAALCQIRCDAYGIPLHVEHIAVPRDSGEGLEGAARRMRHACLAQADCDLIVLAHHQRDQAETILHNLLRGAGVRGAAAMLPMHKGRLRPLLSCSREAIHDYATSRSLQWVEDESNQDDYYTRNFLRLRVLPLLQERFPAAEHNLGSAAAHFAEAQELLDVLAAQDLGTVGFPVNVDLLRSLSAARARNALRYAFSLHGTQAPSRQRMDQLLQQMLEAGPDKHPQIRFGNILLIRHKGQIELQTLPLA